MAKFVSFIVSTIGYAMVVAVSEIFLYDQSTGWASLVMPLVGALIAIVGVAAIKLTAVYDYRQKQEESDG
jgi:uncharacterized membrane protein YdjX (TVP38/TMEM64 family)